MCLCARACVYAWLSHTQSVRVHCCVCVCTRACMHGTEVAQEVILYMHMYSMCVCECMYMVSVATYIIPLASSPGHLDFFVAALDEEPASSSKAVTKKYGWPGDEAMVCCECVHMYVYICTLIVHA